MADNAKDSYENNPYTWPGDAEARASSSSIVGYCQECGRPLGAGSLHRTANGVFCSTCVTQQRSGAGWQAVPQATRADRHAVAGNSRGPSPYIAGLLGFIPGVGAMYNAQYAKGALHLIVFVVLVSLADNLNWVFGWLVAGWIFYQVFDAYHTAVARRDGTPLPNPFGVNDIGERFGAHRNAPAPSQSSYQSRPVSPGPRAQDAEREYAMPGTPLREDSWAQTAEPERQSAERPFSEAVPPKATYTPPTPTPAYMTGVPFSDTYTGSSTPVSYSAGKVSSQRRFPLGALWLIGLGLVFLSGNLLPALRVNARWLVPCVLTGVAIWTAMRRWEQFQVASQIPNYPTPNLLASMTGPGMLLTVALLLSLDAGDVLSMRRSWPLLMVVWGALLLGRRNAMQSVPLDERGLPGSLPRQSPETRNMPSAGL